MGEMIRDDRARDQVQQPNPGLTAEMPEVQFVQGGDLSPTDFQHRPLIAGHARQSPGDFPIGRGAEKQAEVEEPNLGPGILATPLASSPVHRPIRASEFVKEHLGTANSSSPGVTRGPISPEEALGLSGVRVRGDELQADSQPSPMAGNPFPDTEGRSGSGDSARHQVVQPVIDHALSIGATVEATVAKHEIHRVEKEQK
jgi:hypothetical protein